jgi:hypothetical protein
MYIFLNKKNYTFFMPSQSYFSSKRHATHYKVNNTNSLGLLLALISEITFLSRILRASLAA